MEELTTFEKKNVITEMVSNMSMNNASFFICHGAFQVLHNCKKIDYGKEFKTELEYKFPELLDMILTVGAELSEGGKFKFGAAWAGDITIKFKQDKLNILKKSL